jgi:hypothetical protein
VRRITQNKCSRKTFAFHTESSLIRNEETANEWCRNSPGRADERSPVFVRELLSPRSLPVTDTPYYSRYFEGVPRPATSLGFETRTGGKVVEGPTPPVHDRAALGIVDAAVLDDIRLLISQGLLHVRSRLTLSLEVCVARRPSTSLRGAQNKYQKLLRQIQRSMNSLSVIGDQGNQETIPTHSNCGSKDVKTCTAAQTTQEPEAFSILTYGDVRVAASPRIGAFEIWLTWPVHSVQQQQLCTPEQKKIMRAATTPSVATSMQTHPAPDTDHCLLLFSKLETGSFPRVTDVFSQLLRVLPKVQHSGSSAGSRVVERECSSPSAFDADAFVEIAEREIKDLKDQVQQLRVQRLQHLEGSPDSRCVCM